MEGYPDLLVQEIPARTLQTSAGQPYITTQVHELLPAATTQIIYSRNEGGLDANGKAGIIVGVIGIFVTTLGVMKGWKLLRKCIKRKTADRGVEMGVASTENRSEQPPLATAPNGHTTINVNISFLHPQVVAPAPVIFPPLRTPGPEQIRGLAPPERSPTWPSHRILR